MEQVNSFGETELQLNTATLKITGMSKFFEASTNEMKAEMVSATRHYGTASDLDSIIRSTFIRPVFALRECGWSDEEILSLSSFELSLASKVKYSYLEFKDLMQKLNITTGIAEPLALRMLQKKADGFECTLVDEFPQYKTYLEVMDESIASDVDNAKQLLSMVYVKDPPKWYLNMLHGVTYEVLRRMQKHQCVFTVGLALLPLFEKGICSLTPALKYDKCNSIFWVHLVTEDYNHSFPIYRWDLMWKFWDKLENKKLHLVRSDTDLFICDGYAGRYDYGFVDLDEEDPVLAFVDKTMTSLKLDPSLFDEQSKYSNVFFALKEIIAGRKDWYLYLRYPKIFNAFAGFNRGVSIADIIRFGIPHEQKRDVADLCTGLIQMGDTITSIYVAFASDAIQKSLDRGEIINVGCSKEKSLSFNDYATDFINWMQQTGE